MSRFGKYVVAVLVCGSFWISNAHAYVDPGSGSVIITTILGFIAAIGYTFRKYFYRLKRKFTKTQPKDDSDTD